MARDSAYMAEAGSVTLESLGGISTNLWGTAGSLVITGGGMALTVDAVCTQVSASANLNGVTVYAAEFAIIT